MFENKMCMFKSVNSHHM